MICVLEKKINSFYHGWWKGDFLKKQKNQDYQVIVAKKDQRQLAVILPVLISLVLVILGLFLSIKSRKAKTGLNEPTPSLNPKTGQTDFVRFESEKEFKAYLEKTKSKQTLTTGLSADFRALTAPAAEVSDQATAGRFSETNVQVAGIDEPDIVKTDGKEIYFSMGEIFFPVIGTLSRGVPVLQEKSLPQVLGETKVVKAFPPADLAKESVINQGGDLLISGEILIVFGSNQISGFDISQPQAPEEKWILKLENQSRIVAARLFQEKVYVITSQAINSSRPCPFFPYSQGTDLVIRCPEIYHPLPEVSSDVIYTAATINQLTGEIINSLAFIGSSGSSIVYMSPKALYLTYYSQANLVDFYYNFLNQKCQDLLPDSAFEKLSKLNEYDISDQSKLTEIESILQEFETSLVEDQQMQVRNEMTNRMADYHKENRRGLEQTALVKIGLDDFEVKAISEVPGQPLNQFSLDEYQDYFRLVTTVGGTWLGPFGTTESANDLYVLGKDLKIIGSIQNLALGERIYSARFIKDKAFLVTFKQVDPFFIFDLSTPEVPRVMGELKIPGYSSYLHPLGEDLILGIGQENSRVKISLFDVSSSFTPTESDKYLLDENWSDVFGSHHAFLADNKHQIFFLPAGSGGYIFSYQGSKLELRKTVFDPNIRRAVYINDYLYLIGDNEISVFNEISWERVNQLNF